MEFLPVIGERRWVLVTKDKNVRRNQLEISAILNAGVRAFVITASGLNHQQISDLVSRAMADDRPNLPPTRAVRVQHHRDRSHFSNFAKNARTAREREEGLRTWNC